MKILVTGGAGFVGSNLISELKENKEHQIVSLDNYFTGKEQNHVAGVEYIKGDCRDIQNLISFKPDIIFHFGEYSRVSTSFEDLQLVWDYNVAGTFQVLEFCRKNNCKLIYSASSTKFADDGTNRNQSPYAFYKSSNTDLINNYAKWFNIDYSICYFYNVYGNSQIKTGKYATVIGIFEDQYENNKSLTVVKPGYQTRDFTHIDDVVNGLILLIKNGDGDGYCFGTGKKYQMVEVAKMFQKEVEFVKERKGERFESAIDLRKSYKMGWKHKIELNDYINNFIRRKRNEI